MPAPVAAEAAPPPPNFVTDAQTAPAVPPQPQAVPAPPGFVPAPPNFAAAVPQASAAPVAVDLGTPRPPLDSVSQGDRGSRPSRPRIAIPRRRAGEDLIAELFESMHELHFMGDMPSGADFVLAIINEVLPSQGVLIQVFDINTRNFVVIRCKGPEGKRALLHRTSDQDPLYADVMRRPHALSIADTAGDERFNKERWQLLGVEPKSVLCAAVKQGGRYLGIIELANPDGDTPFHQTEVNALDYICKQFAEFLVNRPIVVDADVVLARR
jgi:hypothetical protein